VKRFVVSAVSAVAVGALVVGSGGPAAAGVSKDSYKSMKQSLRVVAQDLRDEAHARLIQEGSPADRRAFLEEVLTEVIGPPSPPLQVSLPEECAAAVAPVRRVMAKYESGFAMSTRKKQSTIEKLNEASRGCSDGSSPDWAHFYVKEFEPWFLSVRANYQVLWNGNGLKLRPKSWKKYQKFGPLCQKLSFDANGWLQRSRCRK